MEYITAIDSRVLAGDNFPVMSIQVPSELVNELQMSGNGTGDKVSVWAASFLFYNVSGLFPSGRTGENK